MKPGSKLCSLLLCLGTQAWVLAALLGTTGRQARRQLLNRDRITALKRRDTLAVIRLLDLGANSNACDLSAIH